MKVIITKVSGYTGLRKIGTEIDIDKERAERYHKLGLIRYKKTAPRRKKKKTDGDTDKKD